MLPALSYADSLFFALLDNIYASDNIVNHSLTEAIIVYIRFPNGTAKSNFFISKRGLGCRCSKFVSKGYFLMYMLLLWMIELVLKDLGTKLQVVV